jgi:sulfonate transport system substrate-binding protein
MGGVTMNRRDILTGSAAIAFATAAPAFARAEDRPRELRIGYQKSSLLLISKARQTLEKHFEPQGIKVSWANFAFGPPLLEALGAGAVDYGSTGDTPPIFAQAAHAKLVYAEALVARGKTLGIVVHRDSSINSIAQLKGKKIGVAKGSSAHNLLVASLEQAGISWTDVSVNYLAPADAAAAFARGAIDAWSIWDPFLAIAELNADARQLPLDPQASTQNAFFLANSDFAAKYPSIVAALNAEVEQTARWTITHREEAARLFSEASGVPLAAEKRVVDRADFVAGPLNADVIARQQKTADRFHKLGLIPARINVSDIVWKAKGA